MKGLKRKFTLIELLVVISIIGILASLLLPSLKKARDASERAVCASNMKQIAISLTNYYGDYDDIFPFGKTNDPKSWDFPDNDSAPPQQLLMLFLDAPEVFVCPTDKTPEDFRWWVYDNHPDIEYASYGINEAANWYYQARYDVPFRITVLDKPTEYIISTDLYHTVSFNPWHISPTDSIKRIDWWHSNTTVNAMYGDGHVESINAYLGPSLDIWDF